MPDTGPDIKKIRHAGKLNEPQQRRLRVTCQYIDKLLSDMESILHSAESQSPFPRYIVDVTPAQTRVFEDHIRRLRSQLLGVLDWQGMKPNAAEIPVTRAVGTSLTFIDIAIEELKPSYMRGSGAVADDAAEELNGVVYELLSLVESMEHYLHQELGTDLESRLRKLEETGCDVELLQLIEQIVTSHGMVELRSRIDLLATRLEDNNLEVALFGRVSSGKSSLLNALLNTEILPVGVTPITAVPIRLQYGTSLRATAAYGDGRNETMTITELAKLVTEQENPGNLKNVVRATIEVPSRRLSQGIVLVDTPGLGSLAKQGSAETLAYLPSCDLALLLIDAGMTLNEEDIGTLRLLYEAGIPAIVLLSKSDLLSEPNIHQVTLYIQEQIQRELGLRVSVHPVSSVPDYSLLLDQFFKQELLPRFNQARGLRHDSVARKIGVLRDAVIAALETTLTQIERRGDTPLTDTHLLEDKLRLVTGWIGEQRTVLDHSFLKFGEMSNTILSHIADDAFNWVQMSGHTHIAPAQLSEWLHHSVQESVERDIGQLRDVVWRSVDALQEIAKSMERNDMPTRDEIEGFLRDMPRFEMAALPNGIDMGHWLFPGKHAARSRITNSLRHSLEDLLDQELRRYGQALSQWSRQFMNKLEVLIHSYTDAYRVQLQRTAGDSKGIFDKSQLSHDLAFLRNWNADESSDATLRHG